MLAPAGTRRAATAAAARRTSAVAAADAGWARASVDCIFLEDSEDVHTFLAYRWTNRDAEEQRLRLSHRDRVARLVVLRISACIWPVDSTRWLAGCLQPGVACHGQSAVVVASLGGVKEPISHVVICLERRPLLQAKREVGRCGRYVTAPIHFLAVCCYCVGTLGCGSTPNGLHLCSKRPFCLDRQAPYYFTGIATVVLLVGGLTLKPDTRITTWAKEEYLRREALENEK
eukprot:scaffold2780_cov206-Prasinococcus_capsulatus_cf.AAC.1